MLVEFSIRQLHPVVSREKKKQENRKVLLEGMAQFEQYGDRFLKNAVQLIGKEDIIFQKLEVVFELFAKNRDELKDLIEKGRQMEKLQHTEK